MREMKMLFAITALLVTASCSEKNREGASSASSQQKAQLWTNAMIDGYQLELIDKEVLLEMGFTSTNNSILVNYKSGDDCALGRLWTWTISEDGELIIIQFAHRPMVRMELKLLSISEKQIIARDGDHEMTFKRYRSKNGEEGTQCKNGDTKMAKVQHPTPTSKDKPR